MGWYDTGFKTLESTSQKGCWAIWWSFTKTETMFLRRQNVNSHFVGEGRNLLVGNFLMDLNVQDLTIMYFTPFGW